MHEGLQLELTDPGQKPGRDGLTAERSSYILVGSFPSTRPFDGRRTGAPRRGGGFYASRPRAVSEGTKGRDGGPNRSMQQRITASVRNARTWGARTWLLIGVGVVFLALFGVVSYLVSGAGDLPGDLAASLWVQSWRTPWLDTLMKVISAPGFRNVSWPLLGAATVGFYARGWRAESALVLGATLLTWTVHVVIRYAVGRPRPSRDLVYTFAGLESSSSGLGGYSSGPAGSSFPSGHVMSYVVFFGVLALVAAWKMRPGPARWFVYTGLVLWLMAVGVSRIYLGAHWLSDVLAAYALGAVVLAAAIGIWRHRDLWGRRRNAEDDRPP